MKNTHFRILIISLILMFSTVACNNKQVSQDYVIVDNSIFLQEKDKDLGINFSSFELEMDKGVDNIVALIGKSIVYYSYNEDGSSITYYKYDIDANITYELGMIDNPYIHTGSVAQIEDRLYFYMNEAVIDSDYPNGRLETTLYEIDTTSNSMKHVYSEAVNQTLIYVDVLNDEILSFKGTIDGAEGTTYIDAVNVGDSEFDETDHTVILSANFDNDNGVGEAIYNFAQYDNHLYTINVEVQDRDNRTYLIRKFDNEGKHIKDIKLGKIVEDTLADERISTFTIIGEYAFIRTFSSTGILCNLSDDMATAKLIGTEDLDIAFGAANDLEVQYALLYSRNKGVIWVLDTQGHTIQEIELVDRLQLTGQVF